MCVEWPSGAILSFVHVESMWGMLQVGYMLSSGHTTKKPTCVMPFPYTCSN